jgi:hypothetical protein
MAHPVNSESRPDLVLLLQIAEELERGRLEPVNIHDVPRGLTNNVCASCGSSAWACMTMIWPKR